jgi:SAM-dependent methyltransferase
MPRVDYDQIAHLYDEPMRAHTVDQQLLAFLANRPDLTPEALRVLDVGCGTGKQLTADRGQLPGAYYLGIDRFRGMLRIAARHEPGIGWINGDGARLPLRSASFDYATNQFSYHHIEEKQSFVRELYRVLRPGGRFVMTNIDPWSMPDWAIYRYFPEAFDQDQRDFLPPNQFGSLMAEAGFVDVTIERRTVVRARRIEEFLAYATDRHRASQFITIADSAYEQGLARLHRAVDASDDGSSTVDLGVSLVIAVGDKPA